MHVQRNSTILAVLLSTLFAVQAVADESATHEKTTAEIDNLIGTIASSYECTMADYSVTTMRLSDGISYLVKGTSSGERCDEATAMLNYRGKSRRWTFIFVESTPQPKPFDYRNDGERSQDLIHEIDPKGDTQI